MSSHRPEIKVEIDTAIIVDLHLQNVSRVNIADALNCDINIVDRSIKKTKKAWLKKSLDSYHDLKMMELAKLDQLEKQAWAGFNRSLQDKETKSISVYSEGSQTSFEFYDNKTVLDDFTIVDNDDISGNVNQELKKSNSHGDAKYLAIVKSCIDSRLKIHEIPKPEVTKVEIIDGHGLAGLLDDLREK